MGFYPRSFEVWHLKYAEDGYGRDLIGSIEKLTEDENSQMLLLDRSVDNGMRYSFVSQS